MAETEQALNLQTDRDVLKRPSFMHRCYHVFALMVYISGYSLFHGIVPSIFVSQLINLEKKFGLTSSSSGFLISSFEIGNLLAIVPMIYLQVRFSTLKILVCGCFSFGLSLILISLVHFLWKNDLASVEAHAYSCLGDVVNRTALYPEDNLTSAYSLLLFLTTFCGAASTVVWTISLTHIDDDVVTQSINPSFSTVGVIFGFRTLGPVVGMFLGAVLSTQPDDLSGWPDGRLSSDWVGNWWLSFVVCGVLSMLLIVPLLVYSRQLVPNHSANLPENDTIKNGNDITKTGNDSDRQLYDPSLAKHSCLPVNVALVEESDNRDQEIGDFASKNLQDQNSGTSSKGRRLRDFSKALNRLMHNGVFVCVTMASFVFAAATNGFFVFLPKYLEIEFNVTMATADVITGISVALSSALGYAVGGYYTSKLKWPLKVLCFRTFAVVIGCEVLFPVLMGLSCSPRPTIGVEYDRPISRKEYAWSDSCSSGCHCTDAFYDPVCAADGTNFYSACHAGCTTVFYNMTNRISTFLNCSCLGGGEAVQGQCSSQCLAVVGYAFVVSIVFFLESIVQMPWIMLMIRSVDEMDKSLALSLMSFATSLGLIPIPALFGSLVDATCLKFRPAKVNLSHHQTCLIYDSNRFRYYFHGVTLSFRILLPFLLLFAWLKSTFPRGEDHDLYFDGDIMAGMRRMSVTSMRRGVVYSARKASGESSSMRMVQTRAKSMIGSGAVDANLIIR